MAPQDSFIDDEDDTCPLCIEEFDLQDKNFRPCPCGYQICQFCFNNLKVNLNGLCPACRRPYDEKTIEWKLPSQEQIAEFKAKIQKNQKKRAAEQRQKETQKRDTPTDKNDRKNLVGVRVVQKNLVYVTGLTPTSSEDELYRTLRKHEFFGQYGNIQKISISNRKGADGQLQSLGIYVTFEKKEDAARCIQAVNGSQNGDRVLRAQLGTTKYCSAWLRHEQCTNRQCMFLHELGDEEDSYTRQDLSSLNSVHTQRPLPNAASTSRSVSRQQGSNAQPAPPAPPTSSQPMVRTSSREGSDNGDGPMLPATANWARTTQQRSRRSSHATSGTAASPAISNALPVTAEAAQEADESAIASDEPTSATASTSKKAEKQPVAEAPLDESPAPPATVFQDPFAMPRFDVLMRKLAACPEFNPINDDDDTLPPLFDPLGGSKRRAMREEDETRLGEQEEQLDVGEPSEGEPESGSHALGGEPEDRDQDRDASGFDQRRNSAQPPIQRTSADGLFGPSLTSTYAQGSTNVGSVGTRAMTPQFTRPQGSYTDQMPPGISAPQSALFPGQGHTRQQSRFSFANENASGSTKVNVTANPRVMAQQNSMMPSTTFHNQPGGQFFASSMSGPPPGLKSTSTPPIGGGIFGQGHGGFGGTGFGAGSKENSGNEVLSLLRRNGGGSSHAQETKREFFSPFQNQYPPSSSSSSTPAPASGPGLLASLYGTQPGAFQDFGPKQKKKGKKHRHANTSSSGGSALVDLADPSILQARMQQHQQQQGNNAGVGQGLFAGQSQDDELLPLDADSVDALVADPDPLEFVGSRYVGQSGTSTPAPPPGLGFPFVQPPPPTQPLPVSSAPSPIVPSSPLVAVPAHATIPQPVTPLQPPKAKSSAKRTTKSDATPGSSDAKRSIQDLAIERGLSKDIAAQASSAAKGRSVLHEEDFPALDSTTAASPPKVTPVVASKSSASVKPTQAKKTLPEITSKAPTTKPVVPPAKSEKRPTPGVLDIAAATKATSRLVDKDESSDSARVSEPTASTSVHPPRSVPPSAVVTPTLTSASVVSPVARAAPKTLRLVQTPRTEVAPPLASSAVTTIRAAASAAAGHRPGTPVSETISDTASVISASVSASRTSSPPPLSRVGAAAARTTTKSQLRKQRKEASKGATAAIIAETKPVETVLEVGPILGRKKKQKKEKKEKISNTASPAVSRPQTPVMEEPSKPEATAIETPAEKPAQPTKGVKPQAETESSTKPKDGKSDDIKSPPKSPVPIDTSIRLNESTKTTVLTPAFSSQNLEPRQEPVYDEGAVGEVPTLFELFQRLVAEGKLPNPDDVSLFKALPNYRADLDRLAAASMASLPPTVKSVVTKDDEAELNAFRPVRKQVNGHRVLLTPNGDFVLNLTDDEERRFLNLQAQVREEAGLATAFVPPKHTPGTGFSLIKGRAVPNDTPSFIPSGPGSFPPDPVSKMHREEAIGCINQHVLPSLNLAGQKPGSATFPTTNSVNLQSLATMVAGSDKGGHTRLRAGDSPHESWDDEGLEDGESRAPAIGSTPLMSVDEAEQAMVAAKKNHEATEKKFKQSTAKIRRQFGMH